MLLFFCGALLFFKISFFIYQTQDKCSYTNTLVQHDQFWSLFSTNLMIEKVLERSPKYRLLLKGLLTLLYSRVQYSLSWHLQLLKLIEQSVVEVSNVYPTNCFCGMLNLFQASVAYHMETSHLFCNWRKMLSLVSSNNHCQKFSPFPTSDTLRSQKQPPELFV